MYSCVPINASHYVYKPVIFFVILKMSIMTNVNVFNVWTCIHSLCTRQMASKLLLKIVRLSVGTLSGKILTLWCTSSLDHQIIGVKSVNIGSQDIDLHRKSVRSVWCLEKVICAVFYVWFNALTPCFKLTSFYNWYLPFYYQLLHYILKLGHLTLSTSILQVKLSCDSWYL